MYCHSPCPQPCSRPPPTHTFAGDFQTPTGKSPVESLFLSPGSWCTGFCCTLQESISQSSVSSGSSIAGLIVTSSKRTNAIPTARAPVPMEDHCWPVPPQEMLKHSSVSVSVGSLDPGAHKVCWALWVSLAGTEFDSKCEFIPPTILLGLLLSPWTWGISSQPLQCLLSYWGFSDLGCGVSPHGRSSKHSHCSRPWMWSIILGCSS